MIVQLLVIRLYESHCFSFCQNFNLERVNKLGEFYTGDAYIVYSVGKIIKTRREVKGTGIKIILYNSKMKRYRKNLSGTDNSNVKLIE